MDVSTGKSVNLDDLEMADPSLIDRFVAITGTDEAIANVSAAVRSQANSIDVAEAKRLAMDELRALNRDERNRGRRQDRGGES